ncbi:MAG: hypothetical protein V3V72_00015 [Ignavibacteriaceae bacterium]
MVNNLEKLIKANVTPDEKTPADGLVIDGQPSINESMLTDESKLVTKKADK